MIFNSIKIFIISVLLIPTTLSIDCSNHDVLKKYQLTQKTIFANNQRSTPPSMTNEIVYLNLCNVNDNDNNNNNKLFNDNCNKNDMVCLMTTVNSPNFKNNNDDILTQLFEIQMKNNNFGIEEYEDKLIVKLNSINWGNDNINTKILYNCNQNLKNDEIVKFNWLKNDIELEIRGPSGCKRSNDDNNDNHDNDNNNNNDDKKSSSSGFSWFTWLFLYAILFTIIYLAIVSYMNTRGGSLIDFRDEFISRSSDLLSSLPGFINEILNKLMGRSSQTSIREGYSAV